MTMEHYGLLADLFDFPGPSFLAQGRSALARIQGQYPEAACDLNLFLDGIPAELRDLQELHTRTFDVQSATTLDVGYVLFGDDYKRAELLAHLAYEHREAKTDCKGELADHLPNLLRLIPNIRSVELRDELVGEILIPALMLMIREFDPDRIQKKNANYRKHYKTLIAPAPGSDATVYRHLLQFLFKMLRVDFQVAEKVALLSDFSGNHKSADFLGLIEKEMEIEDNANPTNSGCDT